MSTVHKEAPGVLYLSFGDPKECAPHLLAAVRRFQRRFLVSLPDVLRILSPNLSCDCLPTPVDSLLRSHITPLAGVPMITLEAVTLLIAKLPGLPAIELSAKQNYYLAALHGFFAALDDLQAYDEILANSWLICREEATLVRKLIRYVYAAETAGEPGLVEIALVPPVLQQGAPVSIIAIAPSLDATRDLQMAHMFFADKQVGPGRFRISHRDAKSDFEDYILHIFNAEQALLADISPQRGPAKTEC